MLNRYIRSGQKLLRCGITTGTCAALATRGAASLLLTGQLPEPLSLSTPKGWEVEAVPLRACREEDQALCSIAKDGGDDPDATDGLEIVATVRRIEEPGIRIEGGPGVGRVTRPGLDQPVGAAAINTVPRRMISAQAEEVCRLAGYPGGLQVIISVPGGEQAAQRTFNPQLGIEGGISILGTSGIVEPMSVQALTETIQLELRQVSLSSPSVILTPGSYGLDFLARQGWDALGIPVVKCSNFPGDALDAAAGLPLREVLLVGHIGKLVKLAGGIFQTHSRTADCRAELFCAHAALQGADRELCRSLMEAPTADACLALLEEARLQEPVLTSLLEAIQRHLDRRFPAGEDRRVAGAVLFSNQYGLLGATPKGRILLERWGAISRETQAQP